MAARNRIVDALALLLVCGAIASAFATRPPDLSPAEAALLLSGNPDGTIAAARFRGGQLESAGANVQRTYRYLAARRTDPLGRWAASEGLDRRLAPQTIFYPFGGPDLAFPLALFPSARQYVLVGLEPPLDALARDPLRAADARVLVGELPAALADLSGIGFFITHKMSAAHGAGRFPGVLSILLATLGSVRAHVDAIEYVCLHATTAITVVERATVHRASDPCGVRIRFHVPGHAGEKTLLYLALSLSDRSLRAHPALEALLASRPYVVFCKAAQYFMHGAHGGSFETVTRLSMGGTAILQDDTCVPLRAFDRERWNLAFFGSYKPTTMYKHMLQPELAQIYAARRSVRPVPQVAGYGGHTNLMLGVRRDQR